MPAIDLDEFLPIEPNQQPTKELPIIFGWEVAGEVQLRFYKGRLYFELGEETEETLTIRLIDKEFTKEE